MRILAYVGAFLVAIGILVAVHEFGHYWVARKLGFKVLRFSIGFGKPLVLRVGAAPDRTEYCLAAIPLGGYVKLLDEREGEVDPAELHRSFTRRPVAARIAVLLAGPAMNLLFASLLYAGLALHGTEVARPVVGLVRAGSPAGVAGLERGDVIARVGDRPTPDTEELQMALIRRVSADDTVPLEILRGGVDVKLELRIEGDSRALTEPGRLLPGLGFDLASWTAATRVGEAAADSAGAKAGLEVGDVLLGVDGKRIANRAEFVSAVSAAPGREISIEFERGGAERQIHVVVPSIQDQGRTIGRLGIGVEEGPHTLLPGLVVMRRSSPLAAIGVGVLKTWDMSAMTVQMLWRMAAGEVSAKNISGPLSIAEFAGVSALMGFTAFMEFLAIISVSLGVLNLMPVPLLDGGQVVYQLVEAVKGSPLSERAQLYGQKVGIALLLVLMSLAFYNDISRHLN
jgi:regulator of sigma E protease